LLFFATASLPLYDFYRPFDLHVFRSQKSPCFSFFQKNVFSLKPYLKERLKLKMKKKIKEIKKNAKVCKKKGR